MALTLTALYKGKFSDRRLHLYSCVFDSSYASGGEAVAPNDIGMDRIDTIVALPGLQGSVVTWDSTALKLRAFSAPAQSTSIALLAESTAGTDLSLLATTIIAIGI